VRKRLLLCSFSSLGYFSQTENAILSKKDLPRCCPSRLLPLLVGVPLERSSLADASSSSSLTCSLTASSFLLFFILSCAFH
jgi:hypothetical protein